MALNPEHGIAVFTDGSAHTKDRSGGWAWVAIDAFDGIESDSGYVTQTTIGQMELCAVGKALVSLDSKYGPQDVLVYSDSEYVVLGFNDPKRKRNKNRDWWDGVVQGASYHKSVTMEHVRGHRGHNFNELADELAGKARKNGIRSDS